MDRQVAGQKGHQVEPQQWAEKTARSQGLPPRIDDEQTLSQVARVMTRPPTGGNGAFAREPMASGSGASDVIEDDPCIVPQQSHAQQETLGSVA